MRYRIELTPDELADLVACVAAYNGHTATGLAIYKGGELVDYDRAVIEAEGATWEVRTKKQDPISLMREMRRTFGIGPAEEQES